MEDEISIWTKSVLIASWQGKLSKVFNVGIVARE